MRASRPCIAPAGLWCRNGYQACPLCGQGEAGAEHLLLWCLAVVLAWRAWAGADARPVLAAALEPRGMEPLLAPFLHQLSFLHCSLLGHAVLDAESAAGRLHRDCARGRPSGDEEQDEEEDDGGEASAAAELHVWAREPVDAECAQCVGHVVGDRWLRAEVAPVMASGGGGPGAVASLCAVRRRPGEPNPGRGSLASSRSGKRQAGSLPALHGGHALAGLRRKWPRPDGK